MSIYLYVLYTIANLALVAWGVTVWRESRRVGTLLIVLVTLGVAYDNLVLSLGNSLGAGPLLLGLSVPRFVIHQLVLPWLIYAGYEQARAAGHAWAQHAASKWVALALTLFVIGLGVLTRLAGLQLKPEVVDGVTRYMAIGTKGPPLVSILSIGFVGIVAVGLWVRNRWPWEAVATVLVLVGEGIPVEWVRRGVGSGMEVLFLAVMLATDRWLALRKASVGSE